VTSQAGQECSPNEETLEDSSSDMRDLFEECDIISSSSSPGKSPENFLFKEVGVVVGGVVVVVVIAVESENVADMAAEKFSLHARMRFIRMSSDSGENGGLTKTSSDWGHSSSSGGKSEEQYDEHDSSSSSSSSPSSYSEDEQSVES